MVKNHAIVLSSRKKDENMLRLITKNTLESTINKRLKIIKKMAIVPNECLLRAVSEAKKSIIIKLENAKVSISDKNIPEIIFINWDDQLNLQNRLESLGGDKLIDNLCTYNFFNSASIVFIRKDMMNIDIANIIFHVMFYSIGHTILSASEECIECTR